MSLLRHRLGRRAGSLVAVNVAAVVVDAVGAGAVAVVAVEVVAEDEGAVEEGSLSERALPVRLADSEQRVGPALSLPSECGVFGAPQGHQ